MITQKIIEKVTYEGKHQFIFSENDLMRKEVVTNMVLNYFNLCNDEPINIYTNEYGLPPINNISSESNSLIICKRYLDFSLAYTILKKIMSQVSVEEINKNGQRFFTKINDLCIRNKKIYSFEELLEILNQMKNDYYSKYMHLAIDKKSSHNIDRPIIQIDIKMFIRNLKQVLKTNTVINLILDIQKPVCMESQMAINELISSFNEDDGVFIKIVCGENDWITNENLSGKSIEYIKNYRTVKLEEDIKSLSR